MLKKLLTFALFACAAAAAHGQVFINADNALGTQNLLLDSVGNPLPVGDIVRLGYFPMSDLAELETDTSYSDLNSIFIAFGEGNSGGGTLTETGYNGDPDAVIDDPSQYGSTPGTFGASFGGVSTSYASLTSTDQLFMWVFNSSTATSATEWGIYTSTDWTFPPATNGDAANLYLGDPVTIVRGTDTVVNGTTDFELANIPEPNTSALACFGSLIAVGSGLLLRRRARA